MIAQWIRTSLPSCSPALNPKGPPSTFCHNLIDTAKFFFELGKLYRLWPKPEAKSLMAFGPGNCSMKRFSLDNRLAAIFWTITTALMLIRLVQIN